MLLLWDGVTMSKNSGILWWFNRYEKRRQKVQNTSTNMMTEGSIAKKMIAFAIPLFFGNLFQQLYNVADSLIVGNALGSESLAAVASSGSLIFLMTGFFNGMAMGAGVLISRYFGAKDEKAVRRVIHTDLAFGILCGFLMTIAGVLFTPQILKLMGTPADVFPNSAAYLRVYFLGSLGVVLYNTCMSILNAVGDSKHPLYYLIISSCVNVVLDIVFCGVLRLSVAFAALATIISQFLSVILCLYRLIRIDDVYQVHIREIRLDILVLKSILQIGLPSGLQNSIISLANVVVQSNINSFGKMAMAGCGAYQKIEGFGFLPVTCFTMALMTFVGQNLGAGEYERVKKGVNFGTGCVVILSELVGITIFTFIPKLIMLFDTNPEVIEFGTLHARTVTLFYFLLAFSHACAAVLQGAGKSSVSMGVMASVWCVFRVTFITIVGHLVHNLRWILIIYPITWGISSVIFTIYLKKADWMHGYEKQAI